MTGKPILVIDSNPGLSVDSVFNLFRIAFVSISFM